MKIFGNLKAQQESLNTLSHDSGYSMIILSGNPGLGKLSFLKSHIETVFDESDVFISDSSISNIRDAVNFASTNPIFGFNKIIIINDAESMAPAAQDACLKICEEPPDCVKIFLITKDEFSLSQALLSRVQKIIKWNPLSLEEMDLFIDDNSLIDDDFLKSIGIPGLYKTILENQYLKNLSDDVVRVIEIEDNSLTFVVPDSIKKLPNKPCPEREAASFLIRRSAVHSLSFISDRKRAKPFLDFSSVLLKLPSANAELHWQRACVLCKMSTHCQN